MYGSFTFNDISSESFGLVSKSVKRPLLPALSKNLAIISGRHGVIDFANNSYETRKITMHIGYIGTSIEELRSRARDIAAWLHTTTAVKLIINDEPDKYYLARVYDSIDLDTMLELGEADITFECQPFAYNLTSTVGDPDYSFSAVGATPFEFNNPGNVNIGCESPEGSMFNIVVDGSWTTLSINLNGRSLNYIATGSGVLTIDNVNLTATLGGVNKIDKLSGDIDGFLKIIPGDNTITVSGTTVNVDVDIQFVPMWI